MTIFISKFTIESMVNPLFVDPNATSQYFTREANGKVQETTLSVTVRVNNLDAWGKIPGVVTRFVFPRLAQWTVIAYIQANQFNELSKLPYVFELEKVNSLTIFESVFGAEPRSSDQG